MKHGCCADSGLVIASPAKGLALISRWRAAHFIICFTTTRRSYAVLSQTPVSGDGSIDDPFKVVTRVQAGSSGLDITQTDTYVQGEESYRTDVTLENTSGSAKSTKTIPKLKGVDPPDAGTPDFNIFMPSIVADPSDASGSTPCAPTEPDEAGGGGDE